MLHQKGNHKEEPQKICNMRNDHKVHVFIRIFTGSILYASELNFIFEKMNLRGLRTHVFRNNVLRRLFIHSIQIVHKEEISQKS